MSDLIFALQEHAKGTNQLVETTSQTSLFESINDQRIDRVRVLLESDKVDVNGHEQRGGFTPLMRACLIGNKDIVKLILKRSPIIDAQNNLKKTALMFACEGGCVDYFIKYFSCTCIYMIHLSKYVLTYKHNLNFSVVWCMQT